MHLKPFCPLALAAIALMSETLLADTPATTQWVVTSAKATGAGGNQYVTSLRIVNPNAFVAAVDMYLLPASDGSRDNSGAGKVSMTVPSNSTLAIDDVLATKFNTVGAGGIRIESTGTTPNAVWVLSQTLVVNAKSSTGIPGTNGFAIPAQSTDQLVALFETAYVPYVSASNSSSSGYHTNLFLLSANGTGSTVVTVNLLKGDGTVLGARDVTLANYGQTQINDIAASFGYTPNGVDTNLTATVTVKSGGPVATGASIIDNAIGSISYAPPVKLPVANNGAYGLILNDPYSVSGRAEVFAGAFDYLFANMVIPDCGGPAQDLLFFFQTQGNNTTFTKNSDGSTSFAGTMSDNATFSGTIQTNFDGRVYGTLTYTRPSGAPSASNPCPAATVTYPFNGAKGLDL